MEIINCQDCKHQKKTFIQDKRYKEGGFWVYGCDLIFDSFCGGPVCGQDDEFCSSAEKKDD